MGGELARAARLSIPLALLMTVINPLVYQEGDTLLVRGGTVLGRRFDVTLEALAAGALAGLRVTAFVMAFGLFSACVDPDELLRLFRRLSYRSALTAALATRLVPVLARDALRMGDAARCRPEPPGRAGRVARSGVGRARPRRRRGGCARGARLLDRGATGRVTRPRSRHDVRVDRGRSARGGGARWPCRIAGAGAVTEYPALEVPLGPGELTLAAVVLLGCRAAVRRAGRRGWGWPVPDEPLVSARAVRLPLPRARRGCAARRDARTVPEGSFCVLAGVSGSGKSTLLSALLRARAPLPRRRGHAAS